MSPRSSAVPFRALAVLFAATLLLPGLLMAQADGGSDTSLDTAWFDGGTGWEARDPEVLPGRGDRAGDSRFVLWIGGPRFAGCLVKTEFQLPQTAVLESGQLSVLIGCTMPPTSGEFATGYEFVVEESGALRILRLDAGGEPVVLAESSPTPGGLNRNRSHVITVGRSGSLLEAKVQPKGEPDPGWQVIASDTKYAEGHVGLACAGTHGWIASSVVVAVEPEGPGRPGKPMGF